MGEDIVIKSNPRLKRMLLFSLLVSSLVLFCGIYHFSLSPYFDVRFIEVRLRRLDATQESLFYKFRHRVNIFQRNVFNRLKFFANDLSPHAKSIVVKRLFPCKVIIYVAERSPSILINTSSGVFMVDRDFVVLPNAKEALNYLRKENKTLPLVVGLEQEFKNVKSGHSISSYRLKVAKEVIDLFNKPPLSRYFLVERINPSQTGRISVFLSDRTEVILNKTVLNDDTDNILTVFSELRKNNIKPKYIDLRFKEPVIGVR